MVNRDFSVYLMRYVYGALYIGVSNDPVKHVADYNERKDRKYKAELVSVIEGLSMGEACRIQLNLKRADSRLVSEYFKDHGRRIAD